MARYVISSVLALGLLASPVSATGMQNEDVEGPAVT